MASSNSSSTTGERGTCHTTFTLLYSLTPGPSWTHLQSSTTVPVVPPRHDEYPRFLSAAWPYYTGAISTSVAFFLFSAFWLASDTRDSRKGKAKAE